MNKKVGLKFGLIFLSFILLGSLGFATDLTGCTQINKSGTYYLTADIINSTATYCMDIQANNVTLDCQGHTIDGIGTTNTYGIYVYRSSSQNTNVTIRNCNVQDWEYGIQLTFSSSNTITNNTANNTFGIRLDAFSNNNTITNNTINNNDAYGIFLALSSNNTIISNIVNNNGYGFYLSSSLSNIITNNTVNNNEAGGFRLDHSSNNKITNNIVNNNGGEGGIYLLSSSATSDNAIYNNFFNNTINFLSYSPYPNNWNTTLQNGTNIIGGNLIGGNYWANPSGTGYSQTCSDADKNGICDSPYTLATNNIDYLPLTTDTTPPQIQFVSPTPPNGSIINVNYATINVSVSENVSSCILNWNTPTVSTPYVWVTNFDSDSVTKLNGSTGATIGTYSVGSGPWGVAVDASGNVWVANNGGASVTKLNGSTGATIGTYSVGSGPYGVAVDASGNVWVANWGSNSVTKLNGSTGDTIGTYSVGSYPYGVAVDASGNVWVVNQGSRSVTKLNGSTGATIGTYSVGTNPRGVAVDASGNVWVANCDEGSVTKLNGTGATIGTYSVGTNPRGVAVDASGNVWVANFDSDSVTKLNGSTGATIGTYSVGYSPRGVAVDASGNVWVANSDDGYVTKLNGSTGATIGRYFVGNSPTSLGDMTGFALQYFVLGYTLGGGDYTMTINNADANTTAYYTVTNLTDGNYRYRVTCSDTAGNTNITENRSLIVDTIPPQISNQQISTHYYKGIVNITNSLLTTTESGVNINVSASDSNLDKVWARIYNGGVTDSFMSLLTGTIYYVIVSLSKGSYNISSYANDTAGNVNNTINQSFDVTDVDMSSYMTVSGFKWDKYSDIKANELVNKTKWINKTANVVPQDINITGYYLTGVSTVCKVNDVSYSVANGVCNYMHNISKGSYYPNLEYYEDSFGSGVPIVQEESILNSNGWINTTVKIIGKNPDGSNAPSNTFFNITWNTTVNGNAGYFAYVNISGTLYSIYPSTTCPTYTRFEPVANRIYYTCIDNGPPKQIYVKIENLN